MRRILVFLAILLGGVSPAVAGITVTSSTTLASTNGYAPSLQGPYFAEQRLEDITPALADVSGDWIGTSKRDITHFAARA